MATANKQVFLVEDDEDILGLIKVVLESEGYDVLCAQNGIEALDALRKLEALPSVILLDLMMPLMDGSRFREEQLKDRRLAKIPVVVMSAANQIAEKSKTLGISSFLKKPLDIDDIINTVEQSCLDL